MPERFIEDSSILIFHERIRVLQLLYLSLESAGYQDIRAFTDSLTALSGFRNRRPDLVVLGVNAHSSDAFRSIRCICAEGAEAFYLPVLVVADNLYCGLKSKVLLAGAKDVLEEPVNVPDLLIRVRMLLETRALYKDLANRNRRLESRMQQRIQELAEAQIEILQRLALAAEYRDDETGQHAQRVGLLTAMLAQQVGSPANEVELVRIASSLHDVGKIGISDNILRKRGKLSIDEFELMKSHTLIGSRILGGSRFPVLQIASQIAKSHHERWDGAGYPEGLTGEAIPFAARATAIADVFDALTHPRPYKETWSLEKAIATIEEESGRHFDPSLVPPFLSLLGAEGLRKLASRTQEESRYLNHINVRALDESVLVPSQSTRERNGIGV